MFKNKLGANIENDESFQLVIKKNLWFAARLINAKGYALVGCTVSPGFHFNDFELADNRLFEDFPELRDEMEILVNDEIEKL